MKSERVEYSSYESLYRPEETLVGWERLVKQQREGYSLGLADTLRSLKAEIVICNENNESLIEAQERLVITQEKQVNVIAIILLSLSDL